MRYNDDAFIERVNKLIKEAIEHGGDDGGAYFSNRDCLVDEMKWFLHWCGIEKDYGIMDEDGWLRFYKKGSIVE